MLVGCGSAVARHRPAAHPNPRATQDHVGDKTSSASAPSVNPQWIMPNRLPLTGKTKHERLIWPLYNAEVSINRFPTSWHGNDAVNTWKLPPRWAPYLLKKEKPVLPLGDLGTKKIPLTLYITLQGTVFLYPQTISENQWPATPTAGDVPPATIVAEFVPLKPAVKAGIIPETDNQPWTLGSEVGAEAWEKALGMTPTQIWAAIK
jgi:hypothetical protein